MEIPQRARRHSLSGLDSLHNKCRVQFEEPFCESKLVADSNVEQLLMQLQEHRVTLDVVNTELFRKVHSTGVYFISIDVQVCFSLYLGLCLASSAIAFVLFLFLSSCPSYLRMAPALWPACSKYLRWLKVFLHFLPGGLLSFCQVSYGVARCWQSHHIPRMHHTRLLSQPLFCHKRVHSKSQYIIP